MELSSFEFIKALSENPRISGYDVSVISNVESSIPAVFKHLKIRNNECHADYLQYGDGMQKWQHYDVEQNIYKALVKCASQSVIYDMSSSVVGSFFASEQRNRYFKSVRLMPYHPAYYFSCMRSKVGIFLTKYQLKWREKRLAQDDIVIRDFIDVNLKPKASKSNYFVNVGRIERRKGIELSAKIAMMHDHNLVCIGKITDKEYFKSLMSKFRNITVMEKVTRKDLLEIIANAKRLVWTPTVPESNGRVVVEALKLGTEVIGVKNGIISDIVTEYDLKAKGTIENHDYFYVRNLPSDIFSDKTKYSDAYLDLLFK